MPKRKVERIAERGEVKIYGREKTKKLNFIRNMIFGKDSQTMIDFFRKKFALRLDVLLCKLQEISTGACNITKNEFFCR